MFQKGPGEGYMAAKEAALALCPSAVCRFKKTRALSGFVVYSNKKHADYDVHAIASGASARDAWNKALDVLGANHDI